MARNGFTKKIVGTLTFGEKLVKLRSERRISLAEVSRVTRIQIKYLEYLEREEFEKLPADVYVVGFLRNYADFMGVDGKVLTRLYEKEKEIKKNVIKSKGKGNGKKEKIGLESVDVSLFIFTPKIISIAVVVLLIFGGFFYLYSELGSFANAPRLVIISPEENSLVKENSVIIEGITDRDARLFVNEQPIIVKDDGKFRETLTVQNGGNTVVIRAVNRFDKEMIKTIVIQAELPEEMAEKEKVSEGNGEKNLDIKNMELEVSVSPGPVWISVEADDSLVFSGTMLEGARQTFSAQKKIVINSGKANATFVKFKGKDIGTLGQEAGPIRGVTFTPETQY